MRQQDGYSPYCQQDTRHGICFGTIAFPARLRQSFYRGTLRWCASILLVIIELPGRFVKKFGKLILFLPEAGKKCMPFGRYAVLLGKN